jgi:hypothetical protein
MQDLNAQHPTMEATAKTNFPVFHWIVRILTGHFARRVYMGILFLLLLFTTAARLRSYLMARKIQAVLKGLAEVRIDQTSEEQLRKLVPYLIQKDWKIGDISHRGFYVSISNESHSQFLGLIASILDRSGQLLYGLGYRFMSFDAGVLVENGKVSQVSYGLANQWIRPQYAGYTGYIVSARSVHGFWHPGQTGVFVTSENDISPQYRPSEYGNELSVIYTYDAPTEFTNRVFRLNLSCFWSLGGCQEARQIAPEMSNDVRAIQDATYQQLISSKCPDSIIEGRMRYLPDISVLLLEVTGSRRIEVNEEGGRAEDWFTDYKVKEVIRGPNFGYFGTWKNVRFSQMIPSPRDPTRLIANQIYPETKIGTQVLFFGNLIFYSCRFIPATPSAIDIVRTTPMPPKRVEDQIPRGLL